jgi:hypothetical protein
MPHSKDGEDKQSKIGVKSCEESFPQNSIGKTSEIDTL